MLTVKQLKQRKIFEISQSESRIYKKWITSAIIREISDSNLETGRNGSKFWSLPDYQGELTALLQRKERSWNKDLICHWGWIEFGTSHTEGHALTNCATIAPCYYFYPPQSSSAIKSKMEGTTTQTYHKIPKISPGAYIFQTLFSGAYIQRGLSMEGNLHFKIDWASLVVGSKFTIFIVILCI